MAYTSQKDGTIIINGFEKGIADDPYKGIADMRNLNIISIPGEASVNFSTAKTSDVVASGSVTSADAGANTVTITGDTFDSGTAIVFSGGSLPAGIVAGTVYWAIGSFGGGVYQLHTNYATGTILDITGTGTGTWATVNMSTPKYFTYASGSQSTYMVDSAGYVWSNARLTQNFFYWTYTGNKINNNSHGNGLVYYRASDGTGYLFVFSDSSIDYTVCTSSASISWAYQWSPGAGTVGVYSATPTSVLKSGSTTNPHEAIVAPDNKVYFVDANWVGRWYQASPTVAFVPTTASTYVFDQTAVLPFTDTAQCLTPLGNNLVIGGKMNIAYPWDTFSDLPGYPIMVAEHNIVKMITINTNIFMLVGNRGRIYVTNGSQAQLYKKIPDHLSGTVEPYYTWGGIASNKNQLYFSALATTNSGTALTTYGAVWAIDTDTKAMRISNQLSYGTYAGYATAIIPDFSSTPAGTGLFVGWNSGASTYGIDKSSSTPYSSGQATVDSDYLPIGTALVPTSSSQVEFKLAVPITSGESIKLQWRQLFSGSNTYTDCSTATLFNYGTSTNGGGTTWTGYSGVYQNVAFQKSQWIQIRAVLTSTSSSPSYVRLTEIRIK